MVLLFLYLLSFQMGFLLAADPTYVYHSCSSNTTTFTRNSTYQSNLNLLLASLTSKATLNSSFYNATAGQDPNKVYGLFLCRGDVDIPTCRDCVTFATKNVTQLCPVQKQAILWYDECLLRYSNVSFFTTMDVKPSVWMWNPQNMTDTDRFDQLVWNLMTEAVNEALNVPEMFATRKNNFSGFQRLYGLVQCTPDLLINDCSRCLREAIAQLLDCCAQKGRGRVLYPSCNIRYELYPFYNGAAPESAPGPTPLLLFPPPAPPSKGRKTIWIAIGAALSAFIVLVLGSFFLWRRIKRDKEENLTSDNEVQLLRLGGGRVGGDYSDDMLLQGEQLESQDFPLFPLCIILEATQNFCEENKLGQGGFGPVYKGILADGKEVAVKRLSRTSGQGINELKNEVTLISKLQHKNLVRLLGCCLEGNESMLIYEYMPNKSLDFLLFDSTRSSELDWKRRRSIINGIARGLLYLHEDSRLRVIH